MWKFTGSNCFTSAEREKIEREIVVTDEKIDEIVYDLYGMTAEEKEIVRGDRVAKEWLRKGLGFIGRVTIGGGWIRAPIFLQPNLDLHIFLPGLYTVGRNEHIPEFIEGQIEDWNIKVIDGATSVSYSHGDLNSLNKSVLMSIDKEAKNLFLKEHRKKKIWTEITFSPKTILFEKDDLPANIPDEWGLTFYPSKNNNILFHFFKDNRNPRGLPRRFPNIFTTVDRSVYFSNFEQWTFEALHIRLKLLTSSLSFFTGAPVTYELLVGRFKREILYVLVKNISNPNAYLCPSWYNGRIEIKGSFLSTFPSKFIRSIEELFKNKKGEKVSTLLSYFGMLYMALYDEAKIAFSFQVMESLAKYKKMKFKRSTTFDEYIGKALDAIKIEEAFDVNPADVKQIARKYRNEVFHGNFFEAMTEIDHLVNTLPEGYKRDLPILLQAVAAMIGVNFIFGIDFNQMIALKSKTNE